MRSKISERSRLELFLSAFPRIKAPRGPGDDCAVISPAKQPLCVTTDALLEGIHFRSQTFSFRDIGHKALAVNLSDLAAMGARPRWFLCALELPRLLGARALRELAGGMAALAGAHRINLLGGNISAADRLAVTVTAAGEVAPGRAILRTGARPGDLLYVSGSLGDARQGLKLLKSSPAARGLAVDRQRRPVPRVALGILATRFASAGMDLSVGLAADLPRLCEASGVGAKISLSALPLSAELRRREKDPSMFALIGGEDYELLLAVPEVRSIAFERACLRAGQVVTAIGRCLRSRRLELQYRPGGPSAAWPQGFEHF